MKLIKAHLPYLSEEPVCVPFTGIQHSWRGIPWPGTNNEEFRRGEVSRCMRRCRTCGAGRVTRYVEPINPTEKRAIGSWIVEGFLSFSDLKSLNSRPGGSKLTEPRNQDAAAPEAPGKLFGRNQ